jgi:hypothetical protein
MENSSNQPSVESPSDISQIDLIQEDNPANIPSLILIIGLVSSAIAFFSIGLFSRTSLYWTRAQTKFNGAGVALTVGTMLSSIVTYYVLQVLGSIPKIQSDWLQNPKISLTH